MAAPGPWTVSPASLEAPTRSAPRGRGGFCPWPRCCPWLFVLLGVTVVSIVGLSPLSLLLVGLGCLLSGCFGRLAP